MLLPFLHSLRVMTYYFFQIISKPIELDRCELRGLLANVKGFIYVTNFFYDLFNLFEAIIKNRTNKKIKKITRDVWNAITSKYFGKLYKLLPWGMSAVILSIYGNIKYSWICNCVVFIFMSINELIMQWETFFFSKIV